MRKLPLFFIFVFLLSIAAAFAVDEVKNGVEKKFYENGQIWFESTFKDGQLNGVTKEYHPNGKLKSET